jgi:hypothetical protein
VLDASAAGGNKSSTKVTIAVWPKGVYGYVSSSNAAGCAQGRKIEVFSQNRPGGPATRLATKSTTRNQVGYIWLAYASRGRAFYAVAKAKPGCAAARSKTISIAPRGADLPRCPDVQDKKCVLVINALSTTATCAAWNAPGGVCVGSTSGDVNPNWAGSARFTWQKAAGPAGLRIVNYSTSSGCIKGVAPAAGTSISDYKVSDAHGASGPHLFTINKPGVPAGQDGGPLFLNFDRSNRHIIIWGTLWVRTGSPPTQC